MSNKSKSQSRTLQSTKYKTERRWESNRRRKLERALKDNPNNAEAITLALKNINYRRKTPKTSFWSKTNIAIAKVYKEFTGKVNMDMFSSNEKVSLPALTTPGPYSEKVTKPGNFVSDMFQLRNRVNGFSWNF